MSSWTRGRLAALDSLESLMQLLEDADTSERRLVLGYLEVKKVLADAFEAFAVEKYADPEPMRRVKDMLEHAMRTTYVDIPEKYFRIRGYGGVHELLLAYLGRRVGIEVSADELRMLTGDAVHTERRARDLRGMGFQLDARDSGGSSVYVLKDAIPDVALGAGLLVAKNIREDKTLYPSERDRLLLSAGLE